MLFVSKLCFDITVFNFTDVNRDVCYIYSLVSCMPEIYHNCKFKSLKRKSKLCLGTGVGITLDLNFHQEKK